MRAQYRHKPLNQQSIVLTGASSGIGLATARAAAAAGAKVFLISRDGAALASICASIAAHGGVAAFAVADVGDRHALSGAASEAVRIFGGVDTWVNIAGVAIYAPLLETPRAEHERLFRTNYWGVVNGCEVAQPLLREGGALITIGSVVAEIGTPVLGAYAASKHAVKGYVDSLRIELLAERSPISVTLIKPSGIGTPLAEHAANHQRHAARVPPPSYGVQSVVDAVLYCAEHPRREVVIGAAGALQILAGRLAPGLLARASILVAPLLADRRRAPNSTNNLFTSATAGEEQSRYEWMQRRSLYTSVALHPVVATLALALVVSALRTLRTR